MKSHFLAHRCASGTGTTLRCDVAKPGPVQDNGFVPPGEHEGACSAKCAYCGERVQWDGEQS